MTRVAAHAPPARFTVRPVSRNAHALLLATALAHLLTRDQPTPESWLTTGFADAVEAERARLRVVEAAAGLPVPETGTPMTFATAVDHLGRDPGGVALAIRRIELARSTVLPRWDELVRRGLPLLP
jgi:hypothetical protein